MQGDATEAGDTKRAEETVKAASAPRTARADGESGGVLARAFGAPIAPEAFALARILFGATLVGSIAELIPLARDLYSDDGVLPRAAKFTNFHAPRLSPLDMFGDPTAVTAFIVFSLLAAVAFCVGWHTRLASVLSCLTYSAIRRGENPWLRRGRARPSDHLG